MKDQVILWEMMEEKKVWGVNLGRVMTGIFMVRGCSSTLFSCSEVNNIVSGVLGDV